MRAEVKVPAGTGQYCAVFGLALTVASSSRVHCCQVDGALIPRNRRCRSCHPHQIQTPGTSRSPCAIRQGLDGYVGLGATTKLQGGSSWQHPESWSSRMTRLFV